MGTFNRIDRLSLNRRSRVLWMPALAVILFLALGMVSLVCPPAFSHVLIVSGAAGRMMFLGFGALWILLLGYLLERQRVISRLRRRVADQRLEGAEAQQAASGEILTTLPGFDLFRDRVEVEYSRASSTHLPLSLLLLRLKPMPHVPDEKLIASAIRHAAEALTRNLRAWDSIYQFPPGLFAVIFPRTGRENASRISGRLIEGLRDAARGNPSFLFDLHLINYREHASAGREMEEEACLLYATEGFESQQIAEA